LFDERGYLIASWRSDRTYVDADASRRDQLGRICNERTAETCHKSPCPTFEAHWRATIADRKEARRAIDGRPQHPNDLRQRERIQIGDDIDRILVPPISSRTGLHFRIVDCKQRAPSVSAPNGRGMTPRRA